MRGDRAVPLQGGAVVEAVFARQDRIVQLQAADLRPDRVVVVGRIGVGRDLRTDQAVVVGVGTVAAGRAAFAADAVRLRLAIRTAVGAAGQLAEIGRAV